MLHGMPYYQETILELNVYFIIKTLHGFSYRLILYYSWSSVDATARQCTSMS